MATQDKDNGSGGEDVVGASGKRDRVGKLSIVAVAKVFGVDDVAVDINVCGNDRGRVGESGVSVRPTSRLRVRGRGVDAVVSVLIAGRGGGRWGG